MINYLWICFSELNISILYVQFWTKTFFLHLTIFSHEYISKQNLSYTYLYTDFIDLF